MVNGKFLFSLSTVGENFSLRVCGCVRERQTGIAKSRGGGFVSVCLGGSIEGGG